ncbi:hypothetical protein [Marinoscillum sp.]|uniref:hypothetical protein n=1 Tax=Marinoscillum sp. TaxID=2024838 RepID=UPI003872E500
MPVSHNVKPTMKICLQILLLFAVTTVLSAQSIDKVMLYDGTTISGQITSQLMPLKKGRVVIQTREGDRTILIDQIDSLRKDDVYYIKLRFQVGNKSYQALGKRYFSGAFSLYDVSVEGLKEPQLLQKGEMIVPIFPGNYEQTFRAVLDRSYSGDIQLRSFKPVYLSLFSAKYHNELGLPYSEYIQQQKRLNKVYPFFGIDFLQTEFIDEGRVSEFSSSNRYNVGVMLDANRFQFIPYLSFGSLMISSQSQFFDGEEHSISDEKIHLNGFGLATNYILAKNWFVEPYLQAGFLYMNVKTNTKAGELVWTYDDLIDLFFGFGLHKNFGKAGASLTYQIRNGKGNYRIFRDAALFEERHQILSANVYITLK